MEHYSPHHVDLFGNYADVAVLIELLSQIQREVGAPLSCIGAH